MSKAELEIAAIGMDLGGTNLEGAIVSPDKTLIDEPIQRESPSKLSTQEAEEAFTVFAKELYNSGAAKRKLITCGIGIPGPFDYDQGISHMEHKYSSLRGRNLKSLFEQALDIPVFFLNDANAFGLGISWLEYPQEQRLVAITLGTGLGSSFIVNGHIGTPEDNVPQNGAIWDYPYEDGILEDKISSAAIRSHYSKVGVEVDVKTIAEKARSGDPDAIETFNKFGRDLGKGLAVSIAAFQPTRVVFGGRISKSFDLFGRTASDVYSRETKTENVLFSSTQFENAALYGAAFYALQKVHTK